MLWKDAPTLHLSSVEQGQQGTFESKCGDKSVLWKAAWPVTLVQSQIEFSLCHSLHRKRVGWEVLSQISQKGVSGGQRWFSK